MSYKVLIVDDDEELAELLKCYLDNAGFNTEVALSGEEALKKYDQFIPHVILLDLIMDNIDGFEVCRRLRGEKKSKSVIIVLSANEIAEDMGRAFNLGANDYIIKSFDVDGNTVIEKIKKYLI